MTAESDQVANLAHLRKCKLWPGSMFELEAKYSSLTYAKLTTYRNGLLRVWNDPEAGPTKGEKEMFNACFETLKEAGLA